MVKITCKIDPSIIGEKDCKKIKKILSNEGYRICGTSIEDPTRDKYKHGFFNDKLVRVIQIGGIFHTGRDVEVRVYGEKYLDRLKNILEREQSKLEGNLELTLKERKSKIIYNYEDYGP